MSSQQSKPESSSDWMERTSLSDCSLWEKESLTVEGHLPDAYNITAHRINLSVNNFRKGVGKTFSEKVFLTRDLNTRAEGTN
jgi:hypothetical protein